MTTARLFPDHAALYPLGNLQPRRRGSGGIEALSSFLAGQALRHSCSPYTLVSSVLIPTEERLSRRWNRVRWGESHLINSYGEIAKSICDAVTACSGLSNARRMTFLGLELLCDPVGKHFMHQVRPWCPGCYREARLRGVPAWDALYTYPRTSKVCVWHGRPLRFTCEVCRLGQRYLPKFPFLDYCEHCGADLASQPCEPAGDSEEFEASVWMTSAALHLLSALERGEPLSAANFAANMRGLMVQHFGGMERPFAMKLGLAGSSPKNWIKRGSAPTWTSLVDLGHRLDVPPAHLGSAELPLTAPNLWRARSILTLDKPHLRPSDEKLAEIRSALAARLELGIGSSAQPLEGIGRLVKRLDVSIGILKRHFPDESKSLIEQRKAVGRIRAAEAANEKARRLNAAAAAVVAENRPVTSRNLKRTGLLKVSDLVPTPKGLAAQCVVRSEC